MSPSPAGRPTLSLLARPYQTIRPVVGGLKQLKAEGSRPGRALIWNMGAGLHDQDHGIVRSRPGGLALLVVLPPDVDLQRSHELLHAIEAVRPQGILPYHPAPMPGDLAHLLRQPPEDLGTEVTEYVRWRGIPLDRETTRLIRRTVTLSAELRSISALARALYLSRRALGRRFMAKGLPVPSHWLHFSRLLRVAIRLQTSEESVLSVAYELGYPDGFSVSNQMMRLTGFRPTDARLYLGWEWLLEAWLRREADSGGLAPETTAEFLLKAPPPAPRDLGRRKMAPRARDRRSNIGG